MAERDADALGGAPMEIALIGVAVSHGMGQITDAEFVSAVLKLTGEAAEQQRAALQVENAALRAHHRLCQCPVEGYDGEDCTFRATATEATRERDALLGRLAQVEQGLRERTWLSPVSAEEMNHSQRFLADMIRDLRASGTPRSETE